MSCDTTAAPPPLPRAAVVLPCSAVAHCIGADPSELRKAELDLCQVADWRFLHLCRTVHK